MLTKIAQEDPRLVVPYARALAALLTHKNTRVRWEAMHALALSAALAPDVLAPHLPHLAEIIHADPSIIVQDYAVDAVGNYAQTSPQAALAAYPILVQSLTVWDEKHAGHALNGLRYVSLAAPNLQDELLEIGFRYQEHERSVVRKAAKTLLKTMKT